MYCTACGRLNANDARFCSACGRAIALVRDDQGSEFQPPIARSQSVRASQPQSPYAQVPSGSSYPPGWAPQVPPPTVHVTQQVQVTGPLAYYQPKSVGLAFALTFFLGPLGLFYSSVIGGVVMLVLSVILAATSAGISLILTWPACIIWGVIAANNYNSALASTSRGPTQINRY